MLSLLALTLTLQTQAQPPPPTSAGGFTINQHAPQEVVVEDPDHPFARRSTAWVAAGSYGLGAMGSVMGGVAAVALSDHPTVRDSAADVHNGARGMAIGALVGLIPGLLFGNEARKEPNTLARGVIIVLDCVGTASLAFLARSGFSR